MSPTSYRTAPPRVNTRNLQFNTRLTKVARFRDPGLRTVNLSPLRSDIHTGKYRKRLGTRFAHAAANAMTAITALVLVISSAALSIGLSRLAVGEFFRLARIDSRRPDDQHQSIG